MRAPVSLVGMPWAAVLNGRQQTNTPTTHAPRTCAPLAKAYAKVNKAYMPGFGKIVVRCFVGLTLFLLPSASVSHAEQTFQDWHYDCADNTCQLQQVQRTPDGLVAIKTRVVERSDGVFALMVAPLGINLARGLSVQVDGAPAERFTFTTCNLGGCFAMVPLRGARLSAWRQGRVAETTYHDGSDTPVVNHVSLMGLTAGLAALAAGE